MPNLVLGIIENYRYRDISTFVVSLKNAMSGEDHVCLYAGSGISDSTIKKIEKEGFEVIRYQKDFPFVSAPHEQNFETLPQPIHIYNFRHFLYYDYLLKNGNRFQNVLITDVKDVVFQINPFGFTLEDKLYVAVENTSILIEGCKCTSKWIRKGYGDEKLSQMKRQEVICAGTTMAPVPMMKKYLQRLIREFSSVKDAYKRADQAMHNVLIHTNIIEPVLKCYNFKGPILTVGTEPTYFLNKQKKLVNEDGNIIPVVHQYDRHKELIHLFRIEPGLAGFLRKKMMAITNRLSPN